ncbi:MAG TPA: tetratricopeptide repeat protein [Longimicrobium sp.]|jgi:tetratricopeptide (TPR) repeat protein|uniref:tetratricopeptide repeat protein n=1 Tax=Longimicrobium sp. TaxID=2029185 RepID=UPI002EDAF143
MADLSPELASRIQQLETSYAGNPGRFFVALAGAWRDAGEISRAEEILRENLKRHHGLSAHVLLGRCLADRGAHQEAANEFHYVLSIDAQNLIALRTLAEMAQANGRPDEARRWYGELLSVDPVNADARAALAALDRPGADAATVDEPVQVGTSWGGAGEGLPVAGGADAGFADDAERGEFGMVDLAPAASDGADATAGLDTWGDIAIDDGAPATAPSAPAADDGFDAFGFGSLDLDTTAASAASSSDAPSGPVDDSGGWMDVDARQDVGESAAADAPAYDDALLNAPLAGAGLPLLHTGDDSAHDHGADHHDDVDAEVVTETMAELYASQGLLDRAADTYRTLIDQRGPEPGLVRRLAEIEAQAGGAAQPAGPSAFGAGDEEEAAPDWLAGVDAFAAGGTPSALPDTGLSPSLGTLDFGAADEPASADAGMSSFDAPTPAAASADPFADSFANGFGGTDEAAALPETAMAAADVYDERGAWEPPTVTPTESAGFDLIVVADDGGELHIPASAEEVADLSADWTIAAAPLDEGDDEDDLPLAAAAPAGSTMAGYFQSLLSWTPGHAAVETPSYEASVDDGTLSIAPAADLDAGAGDDSSLDAGMDDLGFGAVDEPPAQADALAEPGFPAIEPPVDEPSPIDAYLTGADAAPLDEPVAADEPSSIDAYLAGAETAPLEEPAAVDGLGFAGAGTDAVIDAPAAADDEPWAFPGDVPVAGPPVAEPEPEPTAAELEPLDLDEPWAAPSAPRSTVDLEAFELSDELTGGTHSAESTPAPQEPAQADDEGLLPWELPAQPAEPAAAAEPAGGFSFEDFFAGSAPAAPAAPAPEPAPAPTPEPLPTSFPALDPGPYTPPPSAFAPPTPPPAAPSAPAPAAGAQEEDDEDLESFQAWLQSLKR